MIRQSHCADLIFVLQIQTVGGYELWPRKFWMFAMGGLTIAEGILLAVWIVVHAVMFWNWYTSYIKPYDYGAPLFLAII